MKERNLKKQDENNPLIPGMADFIPVFSHCYQVSIVHSEGTISPEKFTDSYLECDPTPGYAKSLPCFPVS